MKISIIVAVYNAEKYLHHCVESLINQTYKDIEIILVDDGSKDQSPLLCDDYAEKYDFIRVFHKENGGQSSARNLGIEKAEGDYIAFVDNDDLIHPKFCEIMAYLAEETGCDIVTCQRKCCDSYEEVVFTDLAFSHEIINTSEIIFNEFVKGKKHRFLNAFHTKLVNKDLLLKHKFNEDLRDEEDTLLATLLFMECPKIGYINQKIYFHITNKNSITHLKENEIKNINYLILSRKLIMEEFALRNYPYLNHVVSNIFIKIIYEYMVLNKKVGPLEKEREKILETFKPYGDILRPFEKKLFCALEEKKYFKLGFLTNKMILQLHMRKAKNII
ncbi:MAG: glycosyltransferase [Abditibacteriota bacterium]|nr:glycosyltransferase [Abditibacteriota bacterium]